VNGNAPSFLFDRDAYTLGRSASRCDLVFAHEGISGQHCKLWREAIDANQCYIAWVQDTRCDVERFILFISLSI
jgi:hypothetical protein